MAARGRSKRVRMMRITVGQPPRTREDHLAVEEPLEIRVDGTAVAVTMRTPGDDWDLAFGYLLGEGVIHHPEQLVALRYCAGTNDEGENTYNVLDAALTVPGPVARGSVVSSACGICGRASLDEVRTKGHFAVDDDPVTVDAALLASLPDRLRAAQQTFEKTGGLHGAALVDAASGELLVVREDVGRHNAVDKCLGWALRENRLPLRGTVLLVSGRASFELAQKAFLAGVPVLAAVSAPSSLAVELATDVGMTLVGFLREDHMNVYTGAQRVTQGRTS